MIRKRCVRTLLFILLLCTLLVALQPGYAGEKGTRGDYPRCQEECLSHLNKHMTEASDDYKKTANRLLYAELVGQARDDYDRCIDNCREIYPVK